jgi:hypothetical protein
MLFLLTNSAVATSQLMALLDADKDGTADLAEAVDVAAALFDRLDGQAEARVFSKETRALFRSNYIALVTRWFRAADLDGDGTLDEDELLTPAGRKLEKLLHRGT